MSVRTRDWRGWRLATTRGSVAVYTPERRVRVHAGLKAPYPEVGMLLARAGDWDDDTALMLNVQLIWPYITVTVTR